MHYRAIPEEEYQQLKQLADLNERAIREIVTDTINNIDYAEYLKEIQAYIQEHKSSKRKYERFTRDIIGLMEQFLSIEDYAYIKNRLKIISF